MEPGGLGCCPAWALMLRLLPTQPGLPAKNPGVPTSPPLKDRPTWSRRGRVSRAASGPHVAGLGRSHRRQGSGVGVVYRRWEPAPPPPRAAYLCLSPEVAVSPEAAALPRAPSQQAQRKAGAGLAPPPRMLSCAH